MDSRKIQVFEQFLSPKTWAKNCAVDFGEKEFSYDGLSGFDDRHRAASAVNGDDIACLQNGRRIAAAYNCGDAEFTRNDRRMG